MYEAVLTEKTIYSSKNERNFLKMLLLRSQKPIKISCYGFFQMCTKDFKDVSKCLKIFNNFYKI